MFYFNKIKKDKNYLFKSGNKQAIFSLKLLFPFHWMHGTINFLVCKNFKKSKFNNRKRRVTMKYA